jgi:ADP-heptose:LPS heptosyltransferase
MKIKFLKLIDRLLGPIAVAVLPAVRPQPVRTPRRILVIRPGGIGDAVLLLPALRALRAAFPGARIDILAERRNAAAFALAGPGFSPVVCYDAPSGVAAALRSEYDVVIDTEQWYRLSAVIARISGPKLSIGFATNERARLFTHPIPYDLTSYEAYSFFRLLEPLGIASPKSLEVPFLEIPEAARIEARTLVAPLGGRPFLTLFPGASVPEKQWGKENFRDLAARLIARGEALVVVGGRDAAGLVGAAASCGALLDLAGRCSLAVSAALIGQGRALITGDSGLLHIAAGLGTPTVSLFCPSDPGKWAPQGGRHLALSAGRACGPCSRFGTIPPCRQNTPCLAPITVDAVLAALDRVLADAAAP